MLVLLVLFVPVVYGGEAGIDPQPVGVVRLPAVLHLHDEALAVLVRAVEVVTDESVLFADAEHLRGEVGDVGDDAGVLGDEGVEEVHQDVLVALGGEQALEPEVGERVHDRQVVLFDVGFCFLQAREFSNVPFGVFVLFLRFGALILLSF